MRFSTDGGQQGWRYLRLPPQSRRTVEAETIDGLEGTAFATAVESDAPIVVDRRMAWGTDAYGAHGETGVASAQPNWYFAEGATGGPFDLFYLLQNPADSPVTVDVTYLQPPGAAPIVRSYTLPPRSRTTIHVDDVDPALASADVSASIAASQPIIAERAMYVSDATLFRGGHASAGIAALSPSWFFAEGATGGFFDLFLLLANPGTDPVSVTVDYLTDGGTVRTKSYTLAARSRRTVWVDDESFGSEGRAADARSHLRCGITPTAQHGARRGAGVRRHQSPLRRGGRPARTRRGHQHHVELARGEHPASVGLPAGLDESMQFLIDRGIDMTVETTGGTARRRLGALRSTTTGPVPSGTRTIGT